MSSFAQKESVREPSAAEETSRLREGTIVQNENEELCGQRRLLDITWNPQLQLHVGVFPQHLVTEDLCNQQRNFTVEKEDLEPPQTKEELKILECLQNEMKQDESKPKNIKEEQEPLQIKEEQERPELPLVKEEQEPICISQDEDKLDLKVEIDTLEIPPYEKSYHSKKYLNKQMSFCVTESQKEERNQYKESTSTQDEETDPQNRVQWKKKGRSRINSLARSRMSKSQSDFDVRKKNRDISVEKRKQSSKDMRLSSVKSGKRKIIGHNVSAHMTAEFDERPYVCKKCGKSFVYLSKFTVHTRRHICCQECGKSFCNARHFKRHMRTHTGEKPFCCQECDKCFKYLSGFSTHMRSHTGEKPFNCQECGKSFGLKCNLKIHMKIHTGQKPFCCHICNKRFSQLYKLKSHIRTHTGEKPFNCQECDKRFCFGSSLKRHMRTHTGEKPFCCLKCGKCFRQSGHLKNHMTTHIGDKPYVVKNGTKVFVIQLI